jgi:flagellar assembly protein FliH
MSSRFISGQALAGVKRLDLASFAEGGGAVPRNGKAPAADRAEEHARGYDEGLRAGLEAGRQAAAAEAQRLKSAADAVEYATEEAAGRLASDAVELALVIARHVLRREIETSADSIVSLVRESIAALPHGTQHAELVLHPEDAEAVRRHLGEQLEQVHWRLAADAGVMRGGCRIVAGCGDVDATLETRWRAVLDALGKDHVAVD